MPSRDGCRDARFHDAAVELTDPKLAYRSSPLMRALRDAETIRQHAMFNRGLRSHLARTIAGTDEAHPPFVI